MLISNYIASVRSDFENVASLASAESGALIERLGSTLAPTLQQRLLEALNGVVQEYNLSASTPLALQVEGDEVRLARLAPSGSEEVPSSATYSARIALRLSDELKEAIEALASGVGSSVNTWIVRALERSVRDDAPGVGWSGPRQLRGRGRA